MRGATVLCVDVGVGNRIICIASLIPGVQACRSAG
jgi:hypothetical protein